MGTVSLIKKIYRIITWASLAALVLVLILVFRKSPPPNVPNDPNAAARAEQKFVAAGQAKAAGQPAQVQLDRTELNSYLAQNLQLAPAPEQAGSGSPAGDAGAQTPNSTAPAASAAQTGDPTAGIAGADQPSLDQVQSSVKDVKVDMDGDIVKTYVVFDFHGKDLSLELDGHLSSENGYLKFDPVAGKLGSLPLPQATLDSAVEKMMNSPENREKLKLPPGVSGIQIVNGQAVVSYQ